MKRILFALAIATACDDAAAPAKREPAKQEPAKQEPAKREPAKQEPVEQDGPPVRSDGTIFGSSTLMGTSVSINLYLDAGKSSAKAGEAMEAALAEMARIEELMSEWRPETELSRLNAASGGAPMKVSAELFEVLARSREISEQTGGAFDVTFHGVGQLWKFETGAKPPDPAAIEAKLPLVDWRKIEIDREAKTVRLADKGMMVGLGAIAKGYAVDRASALLRARGFVNHIVEGGGDTYASGTKGGKPWMVGVQDPDRNDAIGALPASNNSIVTSGDYQRFFEYEGKRYAHILDPRTGYPIPADRSPKSVTVVGPNATDADAYCTAVAVMGPKAGMEFVESRDELEAIIITSAGEVLVSSGLKDVYVPH
jgi:thiamine biosynthesis lipoprotein